MVDFNKKIYNNDKFRYNTLFFKNTTVIFQSNN